MSRAAAKAARPVDSPPLTRRQTLALLDRLYQQHPNAFTELDFHTPFELLVATVLSAQSTDRRVNEVTPRLFHEYPTVQALAAAPLPALEELLKPTGFFRAKSRAVVGLASMLLERFGGNVPRVMEDLVQLPGVGRKTANVVLGHAMGIPALPVDRHVLRVANRLGIAASKTPEGVEAQLAKTVPPERWTLTSDTLILHGRRICRPRPLCDKCPVNDVCLYARTAGYSGAPRSRKPTRK